MNPLYRNDRPGMHAPSWYAASLPAEADRAPLAGDIRCDVAVVGAGYTGLWAALTAARAGLRVVVLEAHRAGWGASGRNGGQVSSGYNKPQRWLEARLGDGPARALWDLAEEAKAQLRAFCAAEAPEARYTPGVAHGTYTDGEAAEDAREAEHLRAAYGYEEIEALDGPAFRDLVKSPHYKGGTLDWGAGHVQPLAYARALARAAEAAGATIFETTEVTRIAKGSPARLHTPQGCVTADHVILAGNGYLPDIEREVNARVMPINSFIAATEPLPERWTDILARDIAVADSRFVVNYYRFTHDRRFLFGGRENYALGFPQDIRPALEKRLGHLFPQMTGVRVDQAWGGTLGVTMTRLPMLLRPAPNILAAGGFSGHGVALSGLAGRAMAEAVAGQAGRFDVLAQLPTPPFPGGRHARAPLLTLAMTWFSLRDRLGI
ncbi:NAD(P)/FAD-dependent oxidoreductase [Pseudoroseicyclus aestuarii]|uniref:Gamma-glutamylputrescine oxidase n=1 Tax=Pseudoroseicyclus aestuarii TaxID=1795041 RepID=A0A318SUV0_9RHOB|nr:FAD-binding oxidoreductase [Pseudoroseicyclus aestuarii]PYE85690.1 gamma-glutamylputrescine oxidase [Pseudoroseicyclus aestuarii]